MKKKNLSFLKDKNKIEKNDSPSGNLFKNFNFNLKAPVLCAFRVFCLKKTL